MNSDHHDSLPAGRVPCCVVDDKKYPVVGTLLYNGIYIPVLDIQLKEEFSNEV